MVLSPGKQADAPPLRSTSGLVLRSRSRPADRTPRHARRPRRSQADGARGEQICRVDRRHRDRISGPPHSDWPVEPAGRTVNGSAYATAPPEY